MSKRKIVGVTVGTSINPQTLMEKTTQAAQIEKNAKDISELSRHIDKIVETVFEETLTEKTKLVVGVDVEVGDDVLVSADSGEGLTVAITKKDSNGNIQFSNMTFNPNFPVYSEFAIEDGTTELTFDVGMNVLVTRNMVKGNKEEIEKLSQEIANQQGQINDLYNKQVTSEDISNLGFWKENDGKNYVDSEITTVEQAIASLNARLGQQTVLVAEGTTQEDALAWLESNGDKTKVYLMPDETFWQYKETTEVGGIAYTNKMPKAIMGSDQTTGWLEEKGYTEKARLSSSGSASTSYTAVAGMCVSGYIPAKTGDVVRIKNFYSPDGVAGYTISYNSSKTKVTHKTFGITSANENFEWGTSNYGSADWYTVEGVKKPEGVTTFTLTSENFGSGVEFIRFSGCITEDTIVTINEEISEGGGTVIVEKWASTGHGLVATSYDEIIASLTSIVNAHTKEIESIRNGVLGKLTDAEKLERIKNWDKPVYDYSEITLLSDDRTKPALTTSDRTVSAVYAKYRALMAKHPKYITETNLGKSTSSDTFSAVDILRFDFKEPDGLVQSSNYTVNETKPKIILMSGVHNEYAGIYGLYYALEEIAENPEFDDIRRNAHIIVVPCSNPFGLTSQTQIDDWQMSHVNANGIAIHNNFGIEYNTYNKDVPLGSFNYGGIEAYSELETQYIDNLMAENSDAIAFVTCHNFNNDLVFGSMAIWASSATAHMCNLAFRLIDKISKAWHNKYGSELQEGIETYKNDALPDGETRLGYAQFSTSAGTEQLNATKYGIQATNLEISDNMRVFNNKQFSSDVMTHGAEVYANYLRIVLSSYNYTDKEEYYK